MSTKFAFELENCLDPRKVRQELEVFREVTIDSWDKVKPIQDVIRKYYIAVNIAGRFCLVFRSGTEIETKLEISSRGASRTRLGLIELTFDKDFFRAEISDLEAAKKKSKKANKTIQTTLQDLCSDGHMARFMDIFEGVSYVPASLLDQNYPSVVSTWKLPRFYFPHHCIRGAHNHQACTYIPFIKRTWPYVEKVVNDPLAKYDKEPDCQALKPIRAFFEMVLNLCDFNQIVFDYVLDWIAYVIYSGKKAQTCLYFYSDDFGNGKSSLVVALSHFVNLLNVPGSTIAKSAFLEPYLQTSLLVVEEMSHSSTSTSKSSAAATTTSTFSETLKNIITNSLMTVERKHQDPTYKKNFVSVMMCSNNTPNDLNALGDRRYVFIKCAKKFKRFTTIYNHLELATTTHFNELWYCLPRTMSSFEMKPCQNCQSGDLPEHENLDLVFLALVFLEIFNRGVQRRFQPFVKPPLTKFHYGLQMQTSKELEILSTFVNLKCNNYFRAFTEDFDCGVAGCQLSREEHFDPGIPGEKWQIAHLRLTSIGRDYDDKKMELFHPDIKKNLFNGSAEYFFDMPLYQVLHDYIHHKLNLENRVVCFKLK